MKKTLLLSAVTLVTLGISSISYGECRDSGDWVCFKPLEDLTYDKEPDASCMEMICRQGCVENIKTGDGACCPVPTEGTNCLDDEYNDKGCLIKKKKVCTWGECQSDGTCGCPEGTEWDGANCVKKCSFNGVKYNENDTVGECGKCQNGVVVVDSSKVPTCKVCKTDWQLGNAENGSNKQTSGENEGKCCVNGVLSYDATLCPNLKCQIGDTWYDNDSAVGACGKCQNGTIIKVTNELDDCHECNSEWQIDEKESAQARICGSECCPSGSICVNGECSQSCIKNVDWGGACSDDCQCKDGTGSRSGWTGVCENGVCCLTQCTFCGSESYCPESNIAVSTKVNCVVDWVSGHLWQYKECTMKITLPDDGTWKLSGDAKVYVGDSSKCYAGIRDGATVQVSGGKITNYTDTYKHAEQFKAYWSYFGREMTNAKLGFTCSTPTITTKGKTIIFKVYVTPHGAHIHVPYAGGKIGKISSASKI